MTIPPWSVLPGYRVIDLVKVGLARKKDMIVSLLNLEDLEAEINEAIAAHRGLSIVRISGDELNVLAEGAGLTLPVVKFKGCTLSPPVQAPLHEPSTTLAPVLAQSIGEADVVGIPVATVPNYLPTLTRSLQAFGVDLRLKRLTTSTVAYQALGAGTMARILLSGRPAVAVVSPEARDYCTLLEGEGVNIAGGIDSLDVTCGTEHMAENVVEGICRLRPQIVLVSVPVTGVILAARFPKETPVISWDIGYLSPGLIAGLRDMVQ